MNIHMTIVPHNLSRIRHIKLNLIIILVVVLLIFLPFFLYQRGLLRIPVDDGVILQEEVDSLVTVFSKIEKNYDHVRTMIEENEYKVNEILNASNYKTEIINDIPMLSYRDPETLQKEVDRQGMLQNRILQELEYDREILLHIPSIAPTHGRVIRQFGCVMDIFTGEWRFCQGIDILAKVGKEVFATADGIVKFAGWERHKGYTVVINHNNGIITHYSHLSRITTKKWKKVKRKDVIGYVGKTGKTEGPKLHYEIWKNGKPVDPLIFVLERIESI